MTPAFPPIEDLLPHRGAMLLLERITASDGSGVEAQAEISPSGWYVDESGAMPGWIGLELMAQAAAAQVGLEAWFEGRAAKPGVLLGTRNFQANSPAAAAGTKLRVTARSSLLDEDGFGAFECAVYDGPKELFSATLTVYQPADFAAFLEQARP